MRRRENKSNTKSERHQTIAITMGDQDTNTSDAAAAVVGPTRRSGVRNCLACAVLLMACAVTTAVFIKVGLLNNPFPALIVQHMSDNLTLRSAAFLDGEPIPRTYTGDDMNVSPPLAWHGEPAGTQSLVLIVEDIDVPGGKDDPFVHWVLYDIKPKIKMMPQHVKNKVAAEIMPRGVMDPLIVRQGLNSFESIGYRGPEPPTGDGKHRYFFHLYAIDGVIGEMFETTPTRADLLSVIYKKFNVLGKGTLVGTYEREV